MISRLADFVRNNRSGATAVEYGLLVALLSVAIIGGASTLGNTTGGLLGKASNTIDNAGK